MWRVIRWVGSRSELPTGYCPAPFQGAGAGSHFSLLHSQFFILHSSFFIQKSRIVGVTRVRWVREIPTGYVRGPVGAVRLLVTNRRTLEIMSDGLLYGLKDEEERQGSLANP